MSSSHRDLSRKNTAMTTPKAQPQIEPAAMSTPMTMRRTAAYIGCRMTE